MFSLKIKVKLNNFYEIELSKDNKVEKNHLHPELPGRNTKKNKHLERIHGFLEGNIERFKNTFI